MLRTAAVRAPLVRKPSGSLTTLNFKDAKVPNLDNLERMFEAASFDLEKPLTNARLSGDNGPIQCLMESVPAIGHMKSHLATLSLLGKGSLVDKLKAKSTAQSSQQSAGTEAAKSAASASPSQDMANASSEKYDALVAQFERLEPKIRVMANALLEEIKTVIAKEFWSDGLLSFIGNGISLDHPVLVELASQFDKITLGLVKDIAFRPNGSPLESLEKRWQKAASSDAHKVAMFMSVEPGKFPFVNDRSCTAPKGEGSSDSFAREVANDKVERLMGLATKQSTESEVEDKLALGSTIWTLHAILLPLLDKIRGIPEPSSDTAKCDESCELTAKHVFVWGS